MKNLIKNTILGFSLLVFVTLTACGQTENNQKETTKVEEVVKEELVVDKDTIQQFVASEAEQLKFEEENSDNPFEGFNLADHPEMTVQKWNTLSTEEKAEFAIKKKAEKIALANFDYASQDLSKEDWNSLSTEDKITFIEIVNGESLVLDNALKEEQQKRKESNKLDNKIEKNQKEITENAKTIADLKGKQGDN